MSDPQWPTHMPIEALKVGDVVIDDHAQAYDAMLPGLGDILRDTWQAVRPQPTCDCPKRPSGTRRRDGQPPRNPHRWNCTLTPIWAQTIRELDTSPWTVISGSPEWNQLIKDYVFNRRKHQPPTQQPTREARP